MRHATGLLLLVLLLGAPAAEAQSYSETTDVVVVEVPVQVLRDGAPVRGLTAKDFEVYERGRKQKIVGFEVLDLKMEVPEGGVKRRPAAPPISARRHFLFLFDLSFTSPKAAARSKEAARGEQGSNIRAALGRPANTRCGSWCAAPAAPGGSRPPR